MKAHVLPWKKLIKEIDDSIANARVMELPLSSIELTPDEWDDFVIARTTLQNGRRLPVTPDLEAGKAIYKQTSIYKEGVK